MKLKCEICEDGEGFETNDPFKMIGHLEVHYKNTDWLLKKTIKAWERR